MNKDIEIKLYEDALQKRNGKPSGAARYLGVSLRTVRNKIDKYPSLIKYLSKHSKDCRRAMKENAQEKERLKKLFP